MQRATDRLGRRRPDWWRTDRRSSRSHPKRRWSESFERPSRCRSSGIACCIAWLALTALAGAAFGVAVLVARRQARHLSAPLETLAKTSERIAAGDLTVRAAPSTIPEIGRVAETHNAMVDKLGDMLQRERHFTANASHQLRTPLTGLQLGLETAREHAAQDPGVRPATRAARSRTIEAEELHRTIDDLLQVARLPSDQWAADRTGAAGRRSGRSGTALARPARQAGASADLAPPLKAWPSAEVPGRVVGQILDILLDNASRPRASARSPSPPEISAMPSPSTSPMKASSRHR